jgi:hypothetical protein
MPEESSAESPLPPGWLSAFITRADLAASYQGLEGSPHFHAETMRGRIRALQLRVDQAARHFERAEALFHEAPRTTPNLLRRFILSIYEFDCILLSGPLDPALASLETFIPEVPRRVQEEHPEVAFVLEYRRSVEGLFRLHVGDSLNAKEIYEELLREKLADQEHMAHYHIGLAAAQHNLGQHSACLESLECAGLCLQAGTKLLPQAQVTGILTGAYKFLGLEEQARSWKLFLVRLPCPQATQDAVLQRGELSISRSVAVSRLVFF